MKHTITITALLLGSTFLLSIKEPRVEKQEHVAQLPKVTGLKNDVEAFFHNAKEKLHHLFKKSSEVRTDIFSKSTFEKKTLDLAIRQELVHAKSALTELKRDIETIEKELERATAPGIHWRHQQ